MPIIWERPDGSILVTQITDAVLQREQRVGESTAAAVLRIAIENIKPKTPALNGLTPVLVPTASMPTSRTKRDGWRLSGTTVVENDAANQSVREAERQAIFDGQKLVKAVAVWTAQKLGIPLATARAEIMTIYRGLP